MNETLISLKFHDLADHDAFLVSAAEKGMSPDKFLEYCVKEIVEMHRQGQQLPEGQGGFDCSTYMRCEVQNQIRKHANKAPEDIALLLNGIHSMTPAGNQWTARTVSAYARRFALI
ncbi:hypothetical protein H0K60_004477 [Salmonella enterica]|nr:hypothetical protein [Salmonella enterica]EFR2649721.1 hypothetical protein [Salmonella enterica]EFS1408070.1 hypothetical protein [Salmonella enterica]EHQ8162517.1 hypothetical protein [Salmonella enterica]EJZ9218170.1 hypothetical protein [Salmonella enterica]